MTIVQMLLFILFAIFPLGQIGRLSFYEGVINVLPIDVIVFGIVLVWFITRKNKKKLHGFLAKPLFIFFCVAVLSLFVNIKNLLLNESLISSLYLIRFLFYASLYFVLQEQPFSFKKRFTFGLLLSGFLVVLLGIVQYFFYPDLRNLYYADWDEHLYRVFSTFLDPNFASAFFVLELLLIGSILSQNVINNTWERAGLVVMAILTFAAILLTYSRAGFFMLFVSIPLFLVLNNQKKLLIGFIPLFMLGILFLPKNLPSEGVNLFRTASIFARGEEAQHALTIIKDNWVFGVGFNAYRFAKRSYGFLKEEDWQTVHSGAGTDQSFLFVLATTGMMGFLSYLFLWYRIIAVGKTALLQKNNFQRSLGIALLCGIGGLFVDSFFINSLFYPHIIIFIWLLAGLTERG